MGSHCPAAPLIDGIGLDLLVWAGASGLFLPLLGELLRESLPIVGVADVLSKSPLLTAAPNSHLLRVLAAEGSQLPLSPRDPPLDDWRCLGSYTSFTSSYLLGLPDKIQNAS